MDNRDQHPHRDAAFDHPRADAQDRPPASGIPVPVAHVSPAPERGAAPGQSPVAQSDGEGENENENGNVEQEEGEDKEEDDDGEEGVGGALREKLISLRTMQPSLRLITGIAIAQLLATALLIAYHGSRLPTLDVAVSNGHVTKMPVAIFVLCVAFLILAWSFVLTGALRAQWLVRLAVLGLFSWLMLYLPAPSVMAPIRIILVVLLWLWGVALWLSDWRAALDRQSASLGTSQVGRVASVPDARPLATALRRVALPVADRIAAFSAWDQGGKTWPLPIRTFLFALVWLTTYYGSFLWSADWGRGAGNLLFQSTITLQLESLTFFLVPVLFLAGSDFAEIGELLASRGALLVRRAGKPWLLASVTALVAAVILWRSLPDPTPDTGTWLRFAFGPLLTALVAACALALAVRFGRVARWPRLRVSAWALIGATVLSAGLATLTIAVVTAHTAQPTQPLFADFSVYRHTSPEPQFSVPYPAEWSVSPLNDKGPNGGTLILFNGLSAAPTGLFTIFSSTQPNATEADAEDAAHVVVQALTPKSETLTFQKAERDGVWTAEPFTLTLPDGKTAFVGTSWTRVIGDRAWCLAGLTVPVLAPEMGTAYASMVEQWRPDLSATVLESPNSTVSFDVNAFNGLVNGFATVAISLLAGVLLLWYGRRRPGLLAGCGLFAVIFGLVAFGEYLPDMLTFAGLPGQRLTFLSMHVPEFQLAIAVGTLATTGWLAARRRLDGHSTELLVALLALNLGVEFIVAMIALYDSAIAAGQVSAGQTFSWAEALIVVIALGWDLVMSGEQITNREGRRFPRHVRLLLYLGYIMFVATAVLFFSSQSLAHSAEHYDAYFESEPWPQLGLQVLGIPLLLTGFALEVSRWWAARRGHEAGVEHAAPAGEAVAAPVPVGE